MPGLPLKIDPEACPHSLYEGIEYEKFWDGSQQHKLDELEHALVRNLLPHSGRRIIDVGCGYGRLADCYLGRFQQVIMVDGSMSLLHQAIQKTGGQAIYIASDVTHLPFKTASFDAVLMIRVFHHIEDSWACLSELHRLLCGDGRLVFSYKNKKNALKVIRWLIGAKTENPFGTQPAGVGSTLISHHPKAVHRMLQESGFSSIEYYGAGILDWLAGRMGFAGRWVTSGEHLASFFGRSKIAPWILCKAIAGGNPDLLDAEGVGNLLQCPFCRGTISKDKQGYLCLMCGRRYPIVDGIIDLRTQ